MAGLPFGRSTLAVVFIVASVCCRPAAAAVLEEPRSPGPAAPLSVDSAAERPELLVEPQVVRGRGQKAGPQEAIVLPASVRAAMSRAFPGLWERQLHGPAGGVELYLQGRFQTAVVATKSAKGRLLLSCTAGTATVTGTATTPAPGDEP